MNIDATMQVDTMKDMDKLLPELRKGFFPHDHPSVLEGERMPGIYTMFFHCPFVFSIEQINQTHKVRKEFADEHLKFKEYGHYLNLVEKPYRVAEYVRLILKKAEIDYEDFITVWCGVENLHEYEEVIPLLFLDVIDKPEELRFDPEVELVEDEEGYITIYRGYNKWYQPNGEGWSYTTSKQKAAWFSQRFVTDPSACKVKTAKVKREDIVFTTNRRSEFEVVPKIGAV
jgi:hypothetical protein